MGWAGHVARMGERIGTYRVLVEKLEGKRPLGIPSIRWDDTFKMHLQELGWDIDWIDLAQDRDSLRGYVNAVMNSGCSIKCGEFLVICVERNKQKWILHFAVVLTDVLALVVS